MTADPLLPVLDLVDRANGELRGAYGVASALGTDQAAPASMAMALLRQAHDAIATLRDHESDEYRSGAVWQGKDEAHYQKLRIIESCVTEHGRMLLVERFGSVGSGTRPFALTEWQLNAAFECANEVEPPVWARPSLHSIRYRP